MAKEQVILRAGMHLSELTEYIAEKMVKTRCVVVEDIDKCSRIEVKSDNGVSVIRVWVGLKYLDKTVAESIGTIDYNTSARNKELESVLLRAFYDCKQYIGGNKYYFFPYIVNESMELEPMPVSTIEEEKKAYTRVMEGATVDEIVDCIMEVYKTARIIDIIVDKKGKWSYHIFIGSSSDIMTNAFDVNIMHNDLPVGHYCETSMYHAITQDTVKRMIWKVLVNNNTEYSYDSIRYNPITQTIDLVEDPSEVTFDEPVSATDHNDVMVKSIISIIYPYQLDKIISKMIGKLDNPLHNGWRMRIQHGPVQLSFTGTREGNKYTIACSISHDEATWQNAISFIVDDNDMYSMNDITNRCVLLYKSVLRAIIVNVNSYPKMKFVFNNRYGLHNEVGSTKE